MSRPSHTVTDAKVKIEVPPLWMVTVSAISRRDYNQVLRCAITDSDDDEPNNDYFQSKFGTQNEVMKRGVNGADSLPIFEKLEAWTLDFSFHHSRDQSLGYVQLAQGNYESSKAYVLTSSRPRGEAAKANSTPDYVTFLIFVEDTPNGAAVGAGQYSDVVAIVHCVDDPTNANVNPPPPPPTTNPGYNPALDRKRPSTIQNYLSFYDTVFLIDDSGSMSGQKWAECSDALIGIADKAVDYDTDGIEIYFLNSTNVIKVDIMNKNNIRTGITRVSPGGGTPTAIKLKERLNAHLNKLDNAIGKFPDYGNIKPLALVVITDGVPDHDPKDELLAASARLKNRNHHPNAIGIQFVQIGNDSGADAALKALAALQIDGMVDTVPYKGQGSLTPAELERILLGGLHPNIRAQRNP